MAYKILADTVAYTHYFWIVFLIFGTLLGTRNKAIRILHIAGLVRLSHTGFRMALSSH
jgi:hypothetical protein